MDWFDEPAQTIEELIAFWNNGQYPPTFEELAYLALRFHYDVYFWPTHALRQAYTDHVKRLIHIPYKKPSQRLQMLLHEVAEILARLPVAPEFVHGLDTQTANHVVACEVEARASL